MSPDGTGTSSGFSADDRADDRWHGRLRSARNDHLRCRAPQRHRYSDALPSAKRKSRRRLPRLRGGFGTASLCRVVHSPGRAGNEGQHRHRSGAERSPHAAGIVDGGPSCSLAPVSSIPATANSNVWLRQRDFSSRDFPGAARRADTTIPPSPSPSITSLAFSATAAFAAATTSATTGCWRGAARVIRRALRSITTCRWATRPASPAANAWCRAQPAR